MSTIDAICVLLVCLTLLAFFIIVRKRKRVDVKTWFARITVEDEPNRNEPNRNEPNTKNGKCRSARRSRRTPRPRRKPTPGAKSDLEEGKEEG
jgi:hypothetical protein